jgi:hypothetical protein
VSSEIVAVTANATVASLAVGGTLDRSITNCRVRFLAPTTLADRRTVSAPTACFGEGAGLLAFYLGSSQPWRAGSGAFAPFRQAPRTPPPWRRPIG